MSDSHTILVEYERLEHLYAAFATRVETLLREILAHEQIAVHSVTSRAKTVESLRRKLTKKSAVYSALNDVTDLAGIRITTFFAEDVDKVATIIEREFTVDQVNTTDKRVSLDPDRFGYLSLHHVVSLHPSRQSLAEYRRFPAMKAEIQTRSILQHAWAEIEHDLGYKARHEIPRHVRRRFSRIAGLLELVDDEFAVIRRELTAYEIAVPEEIRKDPYAVAIDKASLEAFVEVDATVADIDLAIAALRGQGELFPYISPEFDVKRFQWLGLKTIGDIRFKLEVSRNSIVEFARRWLSIPYDDEETEGSSFSRGISFFYLGYVLVAETGDRELIVNYFTENDIGTTRGVHHVAEDVLRVFRELRDEEGRA